MKEIEKLLDKYFAGKTSVQDENELKKYFHQNDIPDKLKIYKELFNFYDNEKILEINNRQFDERVVENIRKQRQSNKSFYYRIIAVAATLLLVFGSYLFFKSEKQIKKANKIVLTSNEKFAINKTIEVFVKVSKIMHSVSEPLSKFQYIKTTDKELNKLDYYNKYNKLVLKYLGAKL